MMLGYARADHLMAKMTPFLMLRTMMTSATSEAEVPSGEDKAKRTIPPGEWTSLAGDQRELQPKP
jgi:hypothetical protein